MARVDKYDQTISSIEEIFLKMVELFKNKICMPHVDKYDHYIEGRVQNNCMVYGDVQGKSYQLEVSQDYKVLQRWQGFSEDELEKDIDDMRNMLVEIGGLN